MKENKTTNIVIVTLFIMYITITGIFTIKNNITKLDKTINETIESDKYLKSGRLEKFVQIRDKIENVLTSNIVLKYDYIDLYGLTQKLMLKKVVADAADGFEVVKLSNNNLTFIYPNMDLTKWFNTVKMVSDYANEKGIYYLYVAPPWRIDKNTKLPFYLEDHLQDVHSRFMDGLNEKNINVINLEKKLSGNSDDWFFKTDHHWNIETAFEAYKIVITKLNDELNLGLTDKYLNDYSKKVYKDIFLGSYGKRTGKYFGGVDDFAYITPNFDTMLDVSYNDWDVEVRHLVGSFEKTLLFQQYVETDELDREKSTYYTYTDGGRALVKIKNYNSYNDKKILVLKDSFGEPVFPFFALNFKETRVIDIRCWRNVNLKKYIDDYEPDAILFIYNPSSLYDEKFVNFKWY